jgi:hypothetical protein
MAVLCGLMVAVPALVEAQAGGDGERARKAAEAILAMRASVRQVTAKAEDARNEKDVVKLNCVNEKLVQMKGMLKVAEQSEAALKEGVATTEQLASAEFAKIGIARSKIDGLGSDAQSCIGQLAYLVDEKTTVQVLQPADQPEPDTSGTYRPPLPPGPPPVSRPPSASTFQ